MEAEPRTIDPCEQDIGLDAHELSLDEIHRAHSQNVMPIEAGQEAERPTLDELLNAKRRLQHGIPIVASGVVIVLFVQR